MPPHADVLQWEHLPFPRTLPQFQKLFPNDEACAAYLEGAKWPKGFVCPHCQEKGEPFRMATRTSVLTCRKCHSVDDPYYPITQSRKLADDEKDLSLDQLMLKYPFVRKE